MKASPRGPFVAITWFCKDGTRIPSVPGKGLSCANNGGGVQHGEWSARTRTMRDAGYLIANVLADMDAARLLAAPASEAVIKQILLEQYLILADDGWIMRGARYYRGAFQMEDERRNARRLLRLMLEDPAWRTARYAVLREAVRLLPHEPDTASLTAMRKLASTIAAEDAEFERLRDKLHSMPGAGDSAAVRMYVKQHGDPAQAERYIRLADMIDQIYRIDASGKVRALADRVTERQLGARLRTAAAGLSAKNDPQLRLDAGATLLALIRDNLEGFGNPTMMLDALDASLAVELETYAAANALRNQLKNSERRQRIQWLLPCLDAVYGAGLLSKREHDALRESAGALDRDIVDLVAYETEIRYIARAPQWSERGLRFHFQDSVDHFTVLDPLARGYFHDRLRGSAMLFFGEVLGGLLEDADRLAGVRHEVFGHRISQGLRALNPGLARGVLAIPDGSAFKREGIYIVEETLPDLDPVAGIVTAGAGNPVSHVQLLARNLGIPNILVDRALLDALRAHAGERVVLAVSPRGTVRLDNDGARWDAVFGVSHAARDILIEPDITKLDLAVRAPIFLSDLRSGDGGRIVGPKAANLGELKHRYPGAVANGVAIPMGVFRDLLERPIQPGGPSAWDWMRRRLAELNRRDPRSRADGNPVREFLETLRSWILAQEFDARFTEELRRAMEAAFGPDKDYGVFVRSDTNVEDLPGFTGAGLNLTVPNVVGFDNVLRAIREVWASPFTERAYSWRQARMKDPAYVFPSVLLLRSVPVDKSGVLVTHDIESGDKGALSIAVNEGIGGAVSGQAAEELRVDLGTGNIRLMARASSPHKRVLAPEGGLERVPASGGDFVLSRDEIRILAGFARDLPGHYPGARNANGNAVTMDVEFGFANGKFSLFQIRPLAENKQARRNRFLLQLDAERVSVAGKSVRMSERPVIN